MPKDKLRIVYVEPHKEPVIKEIEDNLSAYQKEVCGLIEIVYNGDGTLLVCNDEGKLRGMDGNRRIRNGSSVIAGPFFIIGDDGENFRSLTEDEAETYMERFREIEEIGKEETEADMGFTFYSL